MENINESRAHYRVPEPLLGLVIAVVTEAGAVETGVLDVSAGGTALCVPRDSLGELEVGQPILLRLVDSKNHVQFHMESTVRHQHADAEDRVFGVQFRNPALLKTHLPPIMFNVFNRRKSYRVRPAPDDDVILNLRRHADELRLELILCDICADGMGGWSGDAQCAALGVDEAVTVSFSLPGITMKFEIAATLRAVVPLEEGWRTGFLFDTGARAFVRQQDAVMDYVMRRQHELLRSAS